MLVIKDRFGGGGSRVAGLDSGFERLDRKK